MRVRPGQAFFYASIAISLWIWGWTLLDPHGLQYYMELARQEQELQRELQRLRRRALELQRAIHRMQTDPAYVEKLIREQLMYVRPDEIVIPVPPTSQEEADHAQRR